MMKNFKKTYSAACLALLMAASANADDSGTLSISGLITDSTCVIPAAELTRTITLDDISAATLQSASAGSQVGATNFDFNVDGCSAGTNNVGVRFNFQRDASDPAYIQNSGEARGVLLGITKNGDGTRLTTGGTIWSTNYNNTSGAGAVQASIKAYRVGTDAPVAGTINSTATIELQVQ